MRAQHEEITHLPHVGDELGRPALQGQPVAGRSGRHRPGRSTPHAERSTTPGPVSSRVAPLLVLALAIGTSVAQAATYVSGQISTDQRWTTAMSPIILEGDVAVWSDAGNTPVLTIDPGVTVKANAGTALIIGSGTWPGKLYAVGTSASRIRFTANGSTARGFWRGVYYDDGASDTSWQQFTNVTYGGGGGHLGAVQVNASKPTIKNTAATYSSSCGFYLENGAAPVMSGNSASYCSAYPLSFDPSCRIASITSLTGSSTNGTNMVQVRAGDLTGSNDTWKKLSIPMVVEDRVMIYGTATTATKLTISAGATLKFREYGHLVVGSWDDSSLKGTLYAVGTATNRITFSSAQATPAPGDWPGIIMLDAASDASSSIQFATVEWAGRETNAGIWLYSCKPTIKNSVTVKNTAGNGIFMLDSASTITGVTLANNTQYGIRLEGDAARAANLSAITFSGNGKDAVEYARAEIRETSETLPYLGTTSVYELPYGAAVHGRNSIAAKLLIASGVTVKILNNSSLSIGNDLAEEPGILVAAGTSSLPVTIDGPEATPGSWGTLYLNDSTVDASTALDYVTARYATTGFYLSNCSPTLRNCQVSQCGGSGIVLGGACAPVITGGATENNGGYGLEVDAPSLMSGITGLGFAGNGQPIRYVGRQLTGSGDSLPNLGAAYLVEGSILIRGNPGESPLLRLAAGVEMRFPEHERLIVGSSSDDAAGALEAGGTASLPILLRAQTGTWAGVYIDASAIDSMTHMSYVTIMEAGQDDAALYFSGSNPVVDNLTISGSQQYGLILWEAAPTIATATITGAGSAPILASANCRMKNLSGFTFDPGAFVAYSAGVISGESETLPGFSIPYHVTGWIEVYQDPTTAASLTLSPGTRLEFAPATGLNVGTWVDASQGILISAGTESSPVVLTGIDGAPWDSVSFLDGSVDGSTRLDYTSIELAGAGSNRAVYVGSCSPLLYNCRIARSASYGLWAESSPSLEVTSSTFDSNANFPASVDIMTSLAAFTGNIFTNNQPEDAVEQRGGDVTSDTRIAYTEQPYVLNGGISIHGSAETAATLTVDPGVVLKQQTTGGITVGLPTGEKGRLVAEGTALQPITLTTNLTPAPGAWLGLQFFTASPASVLTHCVIGYGGNGGERSVDLIGGAATFENVTIRQGLGTAISAHEPGASATLTDCTLDTFTAQAVELADGSAFTMTGGSITSAATYGVTIGAASPTMSGVTITQCGTAPIRASTASRLKNISSLTLGTAASIEYQAGRLQGEDEAFPGVPIALSGTLQVANDTSTATTLTIGGGATLTFPSGSGLSVGLPTGEKGTLICNGTAGSPIVMDSTSQTAGSWIGLELFSSSGASVLSYTTVTHAGQSNSRTVLVDNASPSLSNCTLSAGSGYGAYITGGAPSITNTLFQDLTSYPISLDIASAATLASNTFSGCNPDAVEMRGGILATDRRITTAGGTYYINGSIEVKGTALAPATLTVDPGVTLAFSGGSKLSIGGTSSSQPGALIAVGSSDQLIVFTGQTQARGAWGGLEFRDGTLEATTHVAFSRVEYGGSPGVSITSSSPLLEDSRITQSSGAGVTASNSSAQLTRMTIDANAAEGVTNGGSLTVDSSTITGNTWGINSSGTLTLMASTVSANSLGGIRVTAGTSSVTGCTISANPTGVYLDGGTAAITTTSISNCTGYPISLDADASLAGSSGLTFSGNGYATIEHRGGSILGSQTLPSLGLPYHVKSDLTIEGSGQTALLTLDAGCVLELGANLVLEVGGYSAPGALRSLGTSGAPVVLRPYNSTSPGAWYGVLFNGSADYSQCVLANLVIERADQALYFAGGSGSAVISDTRIAFSKTDAIYVDTTNPLRFERVSIEDSVGRAIELYGDLTLQDCSILRTGTDAIYADRSTLTLSGTLIDSAARGLYLYRSTPTVLSTVTITNVTGAPFSLDATSNLTGSSSLTLSANSSDTIEIRGGTTSALDIPDLGYPYVVRDDVTATQLMISPGVEMRFDQGSGLNANSLTAIGSSSQPILLTSSALTPQRGDWYGLKILYGDVPSTLEYVTIEYGGGLGQGLLSQGSTTVRHCTIRQNLYGGLTGLGQISDCLITENGGAGVYASMTGDAILERCTITNNGDDGVTIAGGGDRILDSCTISGNAQSGIEVNAAAQITNCTISSNGRIGVEIKSGTPTIRYSVITGNAQGGMTSALTTNSDARYNYWGDPTGPAGVGSGSGDSVGSTYVIFEPWLESSDNPDFRITEGWATNRTVPTSQSIASFWASATDAANWAFQIRDSQGQPVYELEFTGKKFLHRWDCLATGGQPLPAGDYTWRLEAASSANPSLTAAAFVGKLTAAVGPALVEMTLPPEQSEAAAFQIVGSVSGTFTSWALYGGAGEGWLPTYTSLPRLASGTTPKTNEHLAAVDLSSQPPGRYVYVLFVGDAFGQVLHEQRITVTRSDLTVSPNPFSPNGDGVDDTVKLNGTFDATSWVLAMKSAAGALLREWSGTTGTVDVEWDGRDDGGQMVADGIYTYTLSLYQGADLSQEITGFVTLLKAAALVTLTTPAEGFVASNLLDTTSVSVIGTITTTGGATFRWRVEIGAGDNPSSWTSLATGESSADLVDHAFSTSAFDPTEWTNGIYRLRLTAQVLGGAESNDSASMRIGHFLVEILSPSRTFNARLGEQGSIRLHVGFDSDVTVDLYHVADSMKSEEAQLARRLTDRQPYQAGVYDLAWDGRTDAMALATDDLYAVQVTAYQDGAPRGIMGETSRAFYEVLGGETGTPLNPVADPTGTYYPYRQGPIRFNYTMTAPAIIGFSVAPNPDTGRIDLFQRELHAIGNYVLTWDGINAGQAYEGASYVAGWTHLKPTDGPTSYNNLIGLFGTVPRIEKATVDRVTYNPANFLDSETGAVLSFNLDQAADVRLELVGLTSGTLIDEWSLTGLTAGAQEFLWSGTTNAGRSVGAGDYQWKLTATANGVSSRVSTVLMKITY